MQIERMDVDCELDLDRFVAQKTYLAAQYADIYFSECDLVKQRVILAKPPLTNPVCAARLALLKPKVLAEAKKIWPEAKVCDRIRESAPDHLHPRKKLSHHAQRRIVVFTTSPLHGVDLFFSQSRRSQVYNAF
jgi:hypothetical protein